MIQLPGSLKFLHYIRSLSSPWVFEHFLQQADSARKILSTNIIENAVLEFMQPQNLVQTFNSLDQADRLNCALIYLTGNAGMSCEISDPLEHPLVRSFLVFAATDQSNDTRLFGFLEFEDTLRAIMVSTIIECGHTDYNVNISPLWKWRPLNDITILAALASQGELKKTRYGRLARTTIQKIRRLTDYSSESSNYSGDFVAIIMIAYCVAKGIIHEDEIDYRFNLPAFQRWVSISLSERLNDCKEFILNYKGSWRMLMLDELLNASGEKWFSLKIASEKERETFLDSVASLRFAGLFEYKVNDSAILITAVKQFDTHADGESTAIVQADFTAVISQESDPGILYTFTQIGELLSLDKVYKGKVDKKILSNSLSRGVDGDDILEWLNKRQAPPNVVETVREWIREFFRLYFSNRAILVSGDEKVSRQIEAYELLRNQLEIVKAHTIYQIKQGSEAQVKEILSNLGFDYRKPGENSKLDFHEDDVKVKETLYPPGHWKLVTEMRSEDKKQGSSMRGTKYGEELKALDMSEVIHVIDYAVLTGRKLIFDYEGSPYLKPGVYSVLPLTCRKGVEPVFEAEMLKTKTRKQFYIKKIKKIGVSAE